MGPKIRQRVSNFGVPGTATAKQDDRTDIGMAGQVFGRLDKGVNKDASGTQESNKEYELSRTPA